MHVIYIHQHFATKKGATGTRSYELAQRLLQAGHSVTILCGAYDAGDPEIDFTQRVNESQVDGIRILRITEPYGNKMGFYQRVRAFTRFADTAARVAGELHADLVFATSTPLTVGIPGMKAARKLGVPFVFEVRDLWPEVPIALGIIRNPVLKWYTRRLERRIYRAAKHIIALSPGIRDGVISTGYPSERVSMIPNSCDLDLFKPEADKRLDAKFGDHGDFRLIFTGAHGLANGLDAVLEAAVELKRRSVKGVRFIFIGQGREKPRLMERSRREELGELVSWLDPVPKMELAGIVARMNAGLMILKNLPAFYYGTSPNKFFDYIAAGLPVLNNYPGWLADLIKDYDCGLAIPPDDAGAFADAILWMRDHPIELANMGKNARRLAETQFSRDALGAKFVKALEAAHADHVNMLS